MNRLLHFGLAVLILAVTGCASIVSRSDYPVTIRSKPDQAHITITDVKAGKTVFSGATPATVTLTAKHGFFQGKDYTVSFTKAGYSSVSVPVKRGLDGWYVAGNLFFGGLVGYLIVDAASGAMWTLEDDVFADLTPSTASGPQDHDAVRVVVLDDIPQHLRTKLVRVK